MSAKTDGQEVARLATRFRRVRDAHRAEIGEDYVELIAELIETSGEARVADLAARLGVTNATVSNTLQRLSRADLVTGRPYRSISLTPQGRRLASAARNRHRLVRDFLIALGVDRETAEADAEGVEHHVSDTTLSAFRGYLAGDMVSPPPTRQARDAGASRTRRAREHPGRSQGKRTSASTPPERRTS